MVGGLVDTELMFQSANPKAIVEFLRKPRSLDIFRPMPSGELPPLMMHIILHAPPPGSANYRATMAGWKTDHYSYTGLRAALGEGFPYQEELARTRQADDLSIRRLHRWTFKEFWKWKPAEEAVISALEDYIHGVEFYSANIRTTPLPTRQRTLTQKLRALLRGPKWRTA